MGDGNEDEDGGDGGYRLQKATLALKGPEYSYFSFFR
jgi:hypothetical protein